MTRYEVCTATRGKERRGDSSVLHGGVGVVRKGELKRLMRWLKVAECCTDDAQSVSYSAHDDSERCV